MASSAAIQLVLGVQDKASGPLGKISGLLTDLGTSASSAAGTLAKVGGAAAIGGVVAIGAGLVKAASAGLGFNNSMEQATARLNAFTGDGAKTAEILEMVRDRAARTPFSFNEMAAAAASLGPASRAAGVPLEALIAQAEILAASNPAQGFEGAVTALREATGGDFTSIIERFDLPRQRLNELKAQGVPAAEAVSIAMKEMGLNADLVSNMANTAAGRWSTLKDTFTTLASTVTAPIFEGVSAGMGEFQAAIDANMPSIQAFATTLGEKVGAAMTWLMTTAIPGAVAAFQSIGNTLLAVEGPLAAFLDGIIRLFNPEYDPGAYGDSWSAAFIEIGAVLSSVLGPAIQTASTLWTTVLLPAITTVATYISTAVVPVLQTLATTWTERFTTILTTVQTVLPAVQGVIETVFGIIAGFIDQHGASILATLTGAWTTIQTTINTAIEAVGSIVQTVFGVIAGFLDENSASISTTLSTAWTTIQSVIETVVNTVSSVVTTVFSVISSFLDENSASIQAVLTTAWTTIQTVIQAATVIIENIIIPAFTAIASFLSDHTTEITAILTTAWNVISTVITTVMNVVQGVMRTVMAVIKGDWSGAWTEIKGIAETLWNGIKDVIDIAITAVKAVIDRVMPTIQSAMDTVWTAIKSAVDTTWTAIQTSISTKIEAAKTAVGTAVEAVKTAISTAWTAISTATTAAWNAVKTSMTTPIDAAKTAVSTTIEAIKGLFTGGWETAKSTIQGVFSTIGGYISGPIETAKGVVSSAISTITAAIQGVIDLANRAISVINSIPGVPNIPTVPGGATKNSIGGRSMLGGTNSRPMATVDPVLSSAAALGSSFAETFLSAAASITTGLDQIVNAAAERGPREAYSRLVREADRVQRDLSAIWQRGMDAPSVATMPTLSANYQQAATRNMAPAVVENSHYEITIVQQPGEDPRALAERLMPELDRMQRQRRFR